MKQKIEQLLSRFGEELALAANPEMLENLRVNYLGKKGYVQELMKCLRDVEDKKEAGLLINSLKEVVLFPH